MKDQTILVIFEEQPQTPKVPDRPKRGLSERQRRRYAADHRRRDEHLCAGDRARRDYRGYRVVLVADALRSSSDETHDALMTFYHQRPSQQVETVDTETVLVNWNR
jgi:hypothetical protein